MYSLRHCHNVQMVPVVKYVILGKYTCHKKVISKIYFLNKINISLAVLGDSCSIGTCIYKKVDNVK